MGVSGLTAVLAIASDVSLTAGLTVPPGCTVLATASNASETKPYIATCSFRQGPPHRRNTFPARGQQRHESDAGTIAVRSRETSDQHLARRVGRFPRFARARNEPQNHVSWASRQYPQLKRNDRSFYTGMECAYSWHFFIFSLGSCRVVKQSFVLLNPNDFYRNECTSVCPHLNHTFFIKLQPGFESSDAFLRSTSEPYSTL